MGTVGSGAPSRNYSVSGNSLIITTAPSAKDEYTSSVNCGACAEARAAEKYYTTLVYIYHVFVVKGDTSNADAATATLECLVSRVTDHHAANIREGI